MLVGLTGGIATGKSTVARMLADRGAVVLSADDAARQVTAPGSPALAEIARAFGPSVLRPDGSLDRAALAATVFDDPQARRRLEALTHPPILALLRTQIQEARAALPPGGVIVVEVPLLFEAGMEDWFDRVVVVTAPEAQQVARLAGRSDLSPEEARRRIAAQMPLADKEARAQMVIRNGADLAAMAAQVDALAREIGLAAL